MQIVSICLRGDQQFVRDLAGYYPLWKHPSRRSIRPIRDSPASGPVFATTGRSKNQAWANSASNSSGDNSATAIPIRPASSKKAVRPMSHIRGAWPELSSPSSKYFTASRNWLRRSRSDGTADGTDKSSHPVPEQKLIAGKLRVPAVPAIQNERLSIAPDVLPFAGRQ